MTSSMRRGMLWMWRSARDEAMDFSRMCENRKSHVFMSTKTKRKEMRSSFIRANWCFRRSVPRCLAPADGAVVRISCNGGSSWGFFPAIDIVLGLWRYLFLRYPVPFCRGCAISVRLRRWVNRLFLAGMIAGSAYLGVRYNLGALRWVVVFLCLYLAGVAVWMLLGLSKRWPPAGIEILSKWSARERRLEFADAEYERASLH